MIAGWEEDGGESGGDAKSLDWKLALGVSTSLESQARAEGRSMIAIAACVVVRMSKSSKLLAMLDAAQKQWRWMRRR